MIGSNLGLGLTCTPAIPASASISVTIRLGIVSKSSGTALTASTGPLPRTFELPPIAGKESCRYWHETTAPAR